LADPDPSPKCALLHAVAHGGFGWGYRQR
jgi:hypothetical protein